MYFDVDGHIQEEQVNKNRITVTIDSDIEEWLRPESISSGKSMSHLIRNCLREFHELRPDRFSGTKRASSEKAWQSPTVRLVKRPQN